ncbi:hypothetical protein D3C86_2091960 [compost metagenome]
MLLKISMILPFHLITFEPIAILLGKLSFNESVRVIVLQFVWMIVFVMIEKLLWFKVVKKIVVHGG